MNKGHGAKRALPDGPLAATERVRRRPRCHHAAAAAAASAASTATADAFATAAASAGRRALGPVVGGEKEQRVAPQALRHERVLDAPHQGVQARHQSAYLAAGPRQTRGDTGIPGGGGERPVDGGVHVLRGPREV